MNEPQFFFRPEHAEWDFVAERGHVCDAVLIPARYLAQYPKGHPGFGKDPERLAQAALKASRPLYIDPGTPGFQSKTIINESAARLRKTPAAQVVDLPLGIQQLRDQALRNTFVDSCVEGQAGATGTAPPYLDYRDIRDERFGLNVQMLERVIESVGANQAIGFVQVTWNKLLGGQLLESVPRVAGTGVKRVFTRIRGLNAERATAEELEAYADVIEGLAEHEVEAIPDCVGRLGPVLVAVGAAGFSGGAHHFRRVPEALLSSGGGGGGKSLSVELETGGELPRAELPGGDRGTDSQTTDVPDLNELRERRLRIWRNQGQQAAKDPEGFLRSLAAGGDQFARVWAATLLTRIRRAA